VDQELQVLHLLVQYPLLHVLLAQPLQQQVAAAQGRDGPHIVTKVH